MTERNFSHTLRVALVDAGLTQAQIAEMIGLSKETVSRHVRGLGEPTVSQLVRYAEALGVEFLVAPATGFEPVTYRFQPAADQGSAA